jgi:hypothetical protein
MQAPIEVPLTLEVVAEHFEEWRSGKKNGEQEPLCEGGAGIARAER